MYYEEKAIELLKYITKDTEECDVEQIIDHYDSIVEKANSLLKYMGEKNES